MKQNRGREPSPVTTFDANALRLRIIFPVRLR
jgi:hypothetical protein